MTITNEYPLFKLLPINSAKQILDSGILKNFEGKTYQPAVIQFKGLPNSLNPFRSFAIFPFCFLAFFFPF